MKKLFLLAGVAMMLACKGPSTNEAADSTATDTITASDTTTSTKMVQTAPDGFVDRSLSNLDQNNVAVYIKNFQQGDCKLQKSSYLFDSEMVKRALKLIMSEKGDGIRFYFGKKSATDKDVILIPVSTKQSTVKGKHTDYYRHADTDDLFATGSASRPATNFTIGFKPGNTDPGAVLDEICVNCEDRHPTCSTLNYPGAIGRHYAQRMVNNVGAATSVTHAVWFPTASIKRMVDETDCKSLRIYTATYPDNTYNHDKRNTIILTTVGADGKDYFYCGAIKKPEKGKTGDTQNNGELCPDNCDE